MKHLLTRKIFENQEELNKQSPLLKLEDNVDYELIEKIQSLISSGTILEISCGNGADALELLKRGYVVFGTENNQQYADHVNQKINCVKHDTRNKFPFPDNSFDLVYSRLGLHYFSESELQSIFKEISRITKEYLVFTVKLVNDIKTGKTIFDKETWENLVSEEFKIVSSEVKEGILYDNQSKWLEMVARKI
jgi:SAM-dependent methyltransferase